MLERLHRFLLRRLDKLTASIASPSLTENERERAEVLRQKGNQLISQNAFEAAELSYREALDITPNDSKILICLGFALKEQNRLSDARVALFRALSKEDNSQIAFEASYLLGEISEIQLDHADAAKNYALALEQQPDYLPACKGVIRNLRTMGKNHELRRFLEERALSFPENVEERMVLAELCVDSLDIEGSVKHLSKLVSLGLKEARIYITLGAALCRLDKEEESRSYFELAIASDPTVQYEVHYHRGHYYSRCGDTKNAIEELEESIRLQPNFVTSHSLLLLILSHSGEKHQRSYRHAAERFSLTFEENLTFNENSIIGTKSEAKTVLRIGFVAGEFRTHPVLHFLIGILEHIDRKRFCLIGFSNNELDDEGTELFKKSFDEWHTIKNLDDEKAASLIKSQLIDILIDLSGHSGDSRLLVFAKKPAPVQVSWLGYWASTGLKSIDYIISDTDSVPTDSSEWFSETVYRLPHTRLCMRPPDVSRDIPVALSPCINNGYITFGSFQQASKLDQGVIAAWSAILKAIPNSRLRIQNRGIDSPSIRESICANLRLGGVDLLRVDLIGESELEEYLEAHRHVDILLDTFPYPGGTTTAFALWMGVPTITLAGDTMLSRQGVAMLSCVGLENWIAKSVSEYIEIACRFANVPELLLQLRSSLRDITLKSPLFDCQQFAAQFQDALLKMHDRKMDSN